MLAAPCLPEIRSSQRLVTKPAARSRSRGPIRWARVAAFAFTGIFAAGAPGCIISNSWDDGSYVEEIREMDIPHIEGTSVDVTSVNGAIEVVRSDRKDVHITAKVRAKTQQRLDAITVLLERAIPEQGSDLTVSAQFEGKRQNGESVSFRIEIPSADGVSATTSNGRITIDGLAGHAVLRSSNGRLTITNHDGDIDAKSSNGAITVSDSHGQIVTRTSNGSIHITGAEEDVEAVTSNGKIIVVQHPDSDGVLKLQTSNGSISLTLSNAIAGELTARTSNSSVRAQGPEGSTLDQPRKNYATLHFDDSGVTHTLSTSNGSITIEPAE